MMPRRAAPATIGIVHHNCAGLRFLAGERGKHPDEQPPVIHRYAGIAYDDCNCAALLLRVWRAHRPDWPPAVAWTAQFLATPAPRQTYALLSTLRRRHRGGHITFDMHPVRLGGVLWVDASGIAHVGVAEPRRHGVNVLCTSAASGSFIADAEALHQRARMLVYFHPAAGVAAPH